MVFQNKPNVVKYFLFFITFLLSLSLFSNASAIRENIYGIKFNKVNYNTVNPTGTVQDLGLKGGTYLPLTYVNIQADSVFEIGRLSPQFSQSYNIKKNKKFTYQINIIVGYKNYAGTGYQLSPVPQAQCPVGWSSWTIDKCEVSVEAIDSAIVKLYTQGQIEIPQATQLLSEAYSYNRWIINIDGHWRGNDTTVTKFETAGTILSIYNPSIITLQNWDLVYTMSFPTFYFFDEEESAEEEAAEKELESSTNIENQTSQNIGGGSSENQQTTNLIGVFSGFLGQLQSFSATNCNLDLPFPAFIGGTQTVNICQGKDVLGNFITIVGTLAMLTFYIPLAFVLLKMIYNEIRSFTNG